MNPRFDMLDPDDYLYVDVYNRIRKTFPSLTWDDVIRKGLEAWDVILMMDEEADRAEKMIE